MIQQEKVEALRAVLVFAKADRRAVLVSFRAWPTGGRGRSSGRSGLRPGTRFRSASSRAALRDELSTRAGSFMEWPAPPSGAVRLPAVQKEEREWILRSLGSTSARTSAAWSD
jgi:hypothetical protein